MVVFLRGAVPDLDHSRCRSDLFRVRQYSIATTSPPCWLHRPRHSEFPAGVDPDVFRLPLSGLSVGGLFPRTSRRRVEFGEVWDLTKHVPLRLRAGFGRIGASDRIMRANLLDEFAQTLCHHRASQGNRRTARDSEISGARGAEPFASSIAYVFPYLVSGSIIVSLVLGLPTSGRCCCSSGRAGYVLAGTIVLLLGVMTVVGTLIRHAADVDRASTPSHRAVLT